MTGSPSPLEREILRMIETTGPMRLDRFMALCLGHPRHGYYMSRDPFGRAGDFTTAPEISQMFGEIIGIWCMQCFDMMDRPQAFDLIELGPGRGTLMMDLLRAVRAMPDFLARLSLRLIETSPPLRALQQQTLNAAGVPVTWHETLDDISPAPSLIIANEFFDALPLRQFQRLAQGWGERVIGRVDGKLQFGLVPYAFSAPPWAAAAREGDVVEIRPSVEPWAFAVAQRLGTHPGAALIIDYGHLASTPGDTLQALRRHQPVPILDRPGESDLTAHVDFEALAHALRSAGARTCAALTQRAFFLDMGLELRLSSLSRNATEAQKSELALAAERLAGPAQMGHLFKAMAATSPGLPCPHPFRSNGR
jgi:NADH dehydrogenase [ubiquinone] 1 alpha subcomplex assembly factor 7